MKDALALLGWQSFLILRDCVAAQMRAFRDAIPDPLSCDEKRIFNQIYIGTPELGDVPLVMIVGRLDLLREAIGRMWNDPKLEGAPRVVLSMLWYYGQMASNHRAAD